ncbi:class I SAM-dependent methyltransferase [Paenibacillus sp. NPDC057967]|uniref:class I SAM-dependent methyltransferase n=1 Tax=Paenibacillus sp. NPDC057967 TaxID=3346293 RepID=UPI0036D8E3F6
MTPEERKQYWLSEERHVFQGWDFSYMADRVWEQELPWNYKEAVQASMTDERVMLDMGTGGGEFLLSLSPPPGRTYATEAYPPNVALCQQKLPPYGIDIRQVYADDDPLPFEDEMFDLVMNRHEVYNSEEVYRVLKPGGLFITQQVGGQNNRELSRFLLGEGAMIVDPQFNLENSSRELAAAGFTIHESAEFFPEQRFYDVGAFVYLAKIAEWEFAGFSVEKCYNELCLLQEKVEKDGHFTSKEHRFFIIASKQAE